MVQMIVYFNVSVNVVSENDSLLIMQWHQQGKKSLNMGGNSPVNNMSQHLFSGIGF